MITGFNTDVPHEGHVYHVQTEDGGSGNPFLESLIYVGGTIVAKKLTPYTKEQLDEGADQEAIASLLRRQHQIIIAAIKAGRIQDLIRHTQKQQDSNELQEKVKSPKLDVAQPHCPPDSSAQEPSVDTAPAPVFRARPIDKPNRSSKRNSGGMKVTPVPSSARGDTGSLNFDQVIADYLKRGSSQSKLEVKVLTPEVFIAGSSIGLRVEVTHDSKPHFDATVTVKIIGTAFKPQVFIGRVGKDGVASFSLSLPAFTAGTAAIVIEALSGSGRGELKNLIRRA